MFFYFKFRTLYFYNYTIGLVMLLVGSFVLSSMNKECQKAQLIAYNALRGADPNTHIASFGNSDVWNLTDWVPIIGVDKRPPVVSEVA